MELSQEDRGAVLIWYVGNWRRGALRSREAAPMNKKDPQVMKVKEVAEYLKVHRSTIYRLLRRDAIPAFKIGSDWRFNVEEIDKWRLELKG
jgi:excisionase family DNA binding protein